MMSPISRETTRSPVNTLESAGIYSDENLANVNQHQNPQQLANALAYMHFFKITLSAENKKLILNNHNPEVVVRALKVLSKYAALNSTENQSHILKSSNPKELVAAYLALQNCELLNPENIIQLNSHTNPKSFAFALITLYNYKILNETHHNLIKTHPHPVAIATLLYHLHIKNCLNNDTQMIIANLTANRADLLMQMTNHLNNNNLLTSNHLNQFIRHHSPNELWRHVIELEASNRLNQMNIDTILRPISILKTKAAKPSFFRASAIAIDESTLESRYSI